MRNISNIFELETLEFICQNTEPLDAEFSLGLFFNSTEERSLEYCKLFKDKAIKYSILVNFKDEDSNLKTNNLKTNEDNLTEKSIMHEIVTIDDIFDYQNNLNLIIAKIPRSLFTIHSKFFIDITGIPLIYSVALLKYFKMSFPCPTLYLLNVSGKYQYEEKPQFSEGISENIFIPGYYGKPDHSKPQMYIFLLGYEGERSLNIFKDNDPDFVEVIIPAPGYEEGNPEKTIRYNKDFLKEAEFIIEFKGSNIPCDEDIITIPYIEKDNNEKVERKFIYKNSTNKSMNSVYVGSPVDICNKILEIYEQYKNLADIRLVPLGPKPHAIGAGLAALVEENISIMYQTPKKYSMEEVLAGDKMWIYIIK